MTLREDRNVRNGGEDLVHCLNSWYTVVILLTTAAIVTVAPLVTSPLTCFVHKDPSLNLYADQVCWRYPLYADTDRYRSLQMYTYRHYLGVVLVGQALAFLSILLIWHGVQLMCGNPFKDVSNVISDVGSPDQVIRDWSTGYLVKKILMCSRGCNYFLTSGALVVKLLYCLNAILQLTFVSAILKVTPQNPRSGPKWPLTVFAKDILIDIDNTMPENSRGFSRSVLCDFSVITTGISTTSYSAQCEFVISELHESLFAGLWLWLLFVCVVTCVGTLLWSLEIFVPPIRNAYITNRLIVTGRIPDSACATRSFVKAHCSGDAYLITRQVRLTGGGASASEIVARIWDEYQEKTASDAPDDNNAPPIGKGTLTRMETPL